MNSEHSPLGASSMYRWSACPGSVRLSTGIETLQSVYAEEGTEAHTLAAQWLKTAYKPKFPSPEMEETVTVYVEYVRSQREVEDTLLIEHKFDLSSVHPGCFGTADAVIWKPEIKKLIVPDFKYGQGIFVSAINNPQLNYYALGALLTCRFPAETVEMVIVQPRYDHPDGPIRSQAISAIELLDFCVDLKDYAKATEDPNAPLVPGEHCRFCPAAPTCPELASKTQALAKIEFRSDLSYDPQKMKQALDARPFIQAWLKALDEFAYAEAEAGRCPIGYKLVAKRATRKWIDESAIEAHLLKIGVTPSAMYEPKSLKSPAQMEKAGIKEKVFEGFAEAVSSGHTLVPESDKRPPVKPDAKTEFAALPSA